MVMFLDTKARGGIRHYLTICMVLTVCFLLAPIGLVHGGDPDVTITLDVTPKNPVVGSDAGSTSFTVSLVGGTIAWTASVISGGEWLKISYDTQTITSQYDANISSAERTGVIQVTANGAINSPLSVTVTQQAAIPIPTPSPSPSPTPTPVLNVVPSNQDVGPGAGSTSFTVSVVSGTLAWTPSVISGGEWLTISYIDSQSFTCSYNANSTSAGRQGIIQVAALGAMNSPQVVTVTQLLDRPVLYVSPTTINAGKEGNWAWITVSNTGSGTLNWTAQVITGSEWLWIQPEWTGSSWGGVAVGYNSNFGSSSRTGMIRISDSDELNSPVDVTVSQEGQGAPATPYIKINGQDGPITVTTETPVSLTLGLLTGDQKEKLADWWIVHISPEGNYSFIPYNSTYIWSPGISLHAQYALYDFLYNFPSRELAVGEHVFCFGVDTSPNGVLDLPLYYDCVQVNVIPGNNGIIVFPKKESSGHYDLWSMNPDGTNQKRLTDDAKNGIDSLTPCFIPNSSSILYSKNRNIYRLDIKTLIQTTITTEGADYSYGYGGPNISPDGKRIAYNYGLLTYDCKACTTYDIYEMDIDGRNRKRLTNNTYRDTSPIYSPDGSDIVFSHWQGAPSSDCCNDTDTYILALSTLTEKKLYGTSDYDWAYDWSSEGIIVSDSTNKRLIIVKTDGSVIRTIVNQPGYGTFSPDNKQILYTANGSNDLYKVNLDGTGLEKILSGIEIGGGFVWGNVTYNF